MKSYNKKLYPFTSRWINIDNNQIHYVDEGKGDVILFSHPPLGSSYMYRNFIKILKDHFRCIAIDYPGFGLSSADDNYQMSIEGQCDVLKKFIDQLALQDIYVLGHDTGGPSAFGAAISHSKLFKGIILTDTIIYPVSEYKKLITMLGMVGGKLFTWFNATTNFLVYGTTKYGIRTRKLSREERNEYKRMFDTPIKRKRITQILSSLKECEDFMLNIKSGFETVLNDKPALLIYGEKDPVNQLGIADRIHRSMPNSELFLIDNEGHFPHEGQPHEMSKIIHNWISGLAVPA